VRLAHTTESGKEVGKKKFFQKATTKTIFQVLYIREHHTVQFTARLGRLEETQHIYDAREKITRKKKKETGVKLKFV